MVQGFREKFIRIFIGGSNPPCLLFLSDAQVPTQVRSNSSQPIFFTPTCINQSKTMNVTTCIPTGGIFILTFTTIQAINVSSNET